MRLAHLGHAFGAFGSCVWHIWVMRLEHLGHAFGAFGSCVWRIWVMRLEHLGQAHWHSLDLRGGTALGLSLYYTLFSNS